MKPIPLVVLGIDGGGTQSIALATDSTGRVLASARAGSLNFFGSSLPVARRNLRQLVRQIRRRLPPGSPFVKIVVGCAALFSDATPTEKKRFIHDVLSPDRTRVISDCQTASFAANLGQPGVVVIAGTGSIVLVRNEAGRCARAGGWGHLLGDAGSAYWIATESIKAAVAAQEGWGPKTRLGPAICRWFRVRALTDIVPVVYRPDFAKEELARLAGHLAPKLGHCDAPFRAICRRAGRDLAILVSAALRRAPFKTRPVPICLVGGVLTNNALVRDALAAALKENSPVRIRAAHLSPAAGAAAMALIDAGVMLAPEVVQRLKAPFR
jgi:N-acetylglucosamine kinase-like BadF-type ATPase